MADGQTQVASTDTAPAPSGEPVSRESVSGAWIVGSDNPDCRMILAFTKWSGGYRAATKRCSSPEVASVSVWDVQGQQVVLMDANGNTIARLYNSGGERFDGTTNSGQPITFTR
ncbi:protease inhibitor Inh/omp19 family protein [Salaquimonas pukyongi]|uniref:protease inhibitor Inh/omp19 family protein n=1 Tax=Salaquimonas pukyongi TaxID=2712698 RepID=UPI00196830C5|nr:protease inhibitor Inh/omp19 family protein [Salaquimonas pukyongi]